MLIKLTDTQTVRLEVLLLLHLTEKTYSGHFKLNYRTSASGFHSHITEREDSGLYRSSLQFLPVLPLQQSTLGNASGQSAVDKYPRGSRAKGAEYQDRADPSFGSPPRARSRARRWTALGANPAWLSAMDGHGRSSLSWGTGQSLRAHCPSRAPHCAWAPPRNPTPLMRRER